MISRSPVRHYLVATALLFTVTAPLSAQDQTGPDPSAGTPVRRNSIDKEAFAEWDAGQVQAPQDRDASRGPEWVLWTGDKGVSPGHSGLKFGLSKTPGPRHLRIGFTEDVPVGGILTRGNVSVSVLKAAATYPGELADDAHWLAGQRTVDGQVTSRQAERDEYAIWVFPPGTSTRALRFSHTTEPADATYEGWLGGAVVLAERLVNLAPLAIAAAGSDDKHAALINNGFRDGWNTWQNVDTNSPLLATKPVISADHPEWLILTWPQALDLDGIITLWTGFGAVEIQSYRGPEGRHPRDASADDWETIRKQSGFHSGYPTSLWPNPIAFGKTVHTRALRLRITDVTEAKHPHVQNRPANGKRVWLGELMAVQNLGKSELQPTSVAKGNVDEPHAPIPIQFHLPEAGYVTLVIEDATGTRVRNLVSETWFPAGDNTAWWDGTHDLDRDLDAANHGLYNIPARFVEPGRYTARGLWRKELEAFYEFPVYGPGSPPWPTPDHTGGWLANHSPPSAALFVPATHSPTGQPSVFLGCFVTEGPDGFAWVDLDGTKRGGMKWIGGNWTSAPHLGGDTGPNANPGTSAYVASMWETDKNSGVLELRLSALEQDGNRLLNVRQVYKSILPDEPAESATHRLEAIGGIAAYDGLLACALRFSNRVLWIDAKSGRLLGESSVQSPRGIAFDRSGRLLIISGQYVVRMDRPANGKLPTVSQTHVVASELDDPWGLALDKDGRLYISDQGESHQVKVFSPEGKLLHCIGHAGKPKSGPYDPQHMNHPSGLAIDSENHLWVAEHDLLPKRVSVWSLDGKFIRAEYGPAKYGGGGMLDAHDPSRFYYADEEHGTLEVRIDWNKGTSELAAVLYRDGENDFHLLRRSAAPETALYREGRRYFTNCYNSSPTNGSNNVFLFLERDGVARPVAGMGLANEWPLLTQPEFHSRWPEEADPRGDRQKNGRVNQAAYLWVDANEDGRVQPAEVDMLHAPSRGVTIMEDLSFCFAQVGSRALRFRPTSFSATGVPTYDLTKGEVLAEGVQDPKSSGGAQVLADDSAEAIITLGIEPFHSHSICGIRNGRPTWSYPNPWPGLHASHHAAKPDRPGQVIGATRLMGGFIEPQGAQVGPLFAVNANMGNFYLLTRDGLFVATVFADSRLGTAWRMPIAQRGMSLAGLTLHDENFWPSINQTPDGKIYAVDGSHTCLLRLEGLESLRPIPQSDVHVTVDNLRASQEFVELREAARQLEFGSGVLHAAILSVAPQVDGQLADWSKADWVEIDQRGDGANFNSNAKPYHIRGAIAASGANLYAAWDTRDGKLLSNSGEIPNALFKTGGCLDLMIGSNSQAAANRTSPVEGDMRLLITQVKGQTRALLYRAVVPGTATSEKIPFTSPVWSLTFDRVDDVSDAVQLAGDGNGNYEISIPLARLGLKPTSGLKIKGDIGVLRGEGFQTTSRSYWSNKATGITADVPSEAKLSPHLWGTIEWE